MKKIMFSIFLAVALLYFCTATWAQNSQCKPEEGCIKADHYNPAVRSFSIGTRADAGGTNPEKCKEEPPECVVAGQPPLPLIYNSSAELLQEKPATAHLAKWDKFMDDMDYEFGEGKYARNKEYAREKGESGYPRWMEPFSKVDMFGKPTVFSDDFMKR